MTDQEMIKGLVEGKTVIEINKFSANFQTTHAINNYVAKLRMRGFNVVNSKLVIDEDSVKELIMKNIISVEFELELIHDYYISPNGQTIIKTRDANRDSNKLININTD